MRQVQSKRGALSPIWPGGLAVLELGAGQAAAVAGIAASAGLAVSGVARDLAGIERALIAIAPEPGPPRPLQA